jgi:uncharacterized membrane protein
MASISHQAPALGSRHLGAEGGSGLMGKMQAPSPNVGDAERILSGIGGGMLVAFGLSRGLLRGLPWTGLGAALLYRGLTGHCQMYEALGINTACGSSARAPATSVPAGQGVRVDHQIVIQRSPEELYRFWRNVENLPRIMKHLESVRSTGGNRSHWVARGPAGTTVQWDAETITDHRNEAIAWRSLPGSTVDNAGSVHFRPAPRGRGTEVRVEMKYLPPAGRLGATVMATIFGEAADQQIQDDLLRFKQFMESGQAEKTFAGSRG